MGDGDYFTRKRREQINKDLEMTKYKKEKFESLEECVRWLVGGNNVFDNEGCLYTTKELNELTIERIDTWWEKQYKAIPIVTKTVEVEVERWVNIYPEYVSSPYMTKDYADTISKATTPGRIACVKLTGSYEVEV